jgi:N6-L-threonylcarbamoyladenine synthase
MKDHGKYELVGETRDDAAGEAFDKSAQLMGIGYPGGPILSKYARKLKGESSMDFPRPMMGDKNNFDFSFSGLKTSILYKIKKDPNWKKKIPEYCYAFEQAVVDVLITKMLRAAEKYRVKSLMLAGGVSANTELRKQFKKRTKELDFKPEIILPNLKYTTDNAVMIATAGYFRARDNKFDSWNKIKVNPNLEL